MQGKMPRRAIGAMTRAIKIIVLALFVTFTSAGILSRHGAAGGQGQPVQLVVVYKNDGAIKKVVAAIGNITAASAAFLDQFVGKGHHDEFHVGGDITYSGSNITAAEAVAHALKRDVLIMQALYGKAHGH
jgi:hypothetical protein